MSDVQPDGIALHPYGYGAVGNERYAAFGSLENVLAAYATLGLPLWITEWGVLNFPADAPAEVASYAQAFIDQVNRDYGDRVAAAIWYSWADGLSNSYGLVYSNGLPKSPLYEVFTDKTPQ
jgi:hypothetical protein